MGCGSGNCGKTAKKIAGTRKAPKAQSNTTPSYRTSNASNKNFPPSGTQKTISSNSSTKSRVKIIRNGKVISQR